MLQLLTFVILVVTSTPLIVAHVDFQPQQVHLSFGENVSEMVVTWSTVQDTKESIVEYGIDGLALSAQGSRKRFEDLDSKRVQFIHRVTLKNLRPNSFYMYHCGSNLGWSDLFAFRTVPQGENWSPSLAIYGDLGNENGQSVARLQEETQRGMYDAIFHIGDFAYDMDSEGGEVGDQFMRQIQPIAAYLPYMTCPGNHESASNFSHYRARFSMPGGTENLYYSFNLGPVHFIFISTEVYYYINYGVKLIISQYEWLENDLMEATKPEIRQKRPWIVLMGHRPMYCSNNDKDDCTNHNTLTRVGIPGLEMFGVEPLLNKYGVDLVLWAHEHSYERLWPIYDYQVYNGSLNKPYENPKAPVHIISGSAGCQEKTDGFIKPKPSWSAFTSSDYGYMRMKAWNGTHLYLEQVSDDQKGKVIDNIWLIKDKHVPYNFV